MTNETNGMLHVRVKRQIGPAGQASWDEFDVDATSCVTVMDVLSAMNLQIVRQGGMPVAFAQSCQVRKCGACAMVINGVPRLACGTFLADLGHGGTIVLEPLSKFLVIKDLMVDKSSIDAMLAQAEIWPHGETRHPEKHEEQRFASASCVQCGCCLEACPDYLPGNGTMGPAGMVNAWRIADGIADSSTRRAYARTCGKLGKDHCAHATSCQTVCPIGLPVTNLIATLATSK